MRRKTFDRGEISGWLIATICLAIIAVGLGALTIWLYFQYNDQKTNVDTKIETAVIDAKKVQADELETKFIEREKQPNEEFVGPEDYGLVTFSYPKTWSVYVAKDATKGGDYEAYLNPKTVPTVSATQQFALRVIIKDKDYDDVVSSYDSLVKKGSLKASVVDVNTNKGTRLEGDFTKDIRGAAAVFKIRDKTLIIQTDAQTFINNGDFETVVKSIKINK